MTIERLILCRRLLQVHGFAEDDFVYSHQLAGLISATADQVRRDLMAVAVAGNSKRGYRVGDLLRGIGELLDTPAGTRAVLVGAGDLGRAVLRFVKGYEREIRIMAAFDNDPFKIGRVVHGYACRAVEDLKSVVEAEGVTLGIITTPAPAAQQVCEALAAAGVRGIVNFAPAPLYAPKGIWVERVDIATALEKAACLMRRSTEA